MTKVAYIRKKNLPTRKVELNLRKKQIKYYILIIALCVAKTWHFGK
jgi:hypothetical protein